MFYGIELDAILNISAYAFTTYSACAIALRLELDDGVWTASVKRSGTVIECSQAYRHFVPFVVGALILRVLIGLAMCAINLATSIKGHHY